ncbi:MAG TPA: putative Ig domain-containing protein [bacterium]|nr:putative Ig domain-containing protein [bacterium]
MRKYYLFIYIFVIISGGLWGEVINPAILPLAQENTIVLEHSGAYDLDNNNLLDMVAITCSVNSEGQPVKDSTSLVLLELRPNSVIKQLWEYKLLSGRFLDVKVADINGDGQQEFAAICKFDYAPEEGESDWLYIFEKQGKNVVRKYEPINRNYPEVNAEYIDVGDFNNDGVDDLLISSGSPTRGAYIIRSQRFGTGQESTIMVNKLQLRSGVARFRAFSANIDSLPGDEIIMLGGRDYAELLGYSLKSGSLSGSNFVFEKEQIDGLKIDLALSANLDSSAYDEIVLPFKNGSNYLLRFQNQNFTAYPIKKMDEKVKDIKTKNMGYGEIEDIFYLAEDDTRVYRLEFEASDSAKIVFNKKFYYNPYFSDVELLSLGFSSEFRRSAGPAMIIPYYNQNFYKHGISYWLMEQKTARPDTGPPEVREEIAGLEEQKSGLLDFAEIGSLRDEYSHVEGREVPLANYKNHKQLLSKQIDRNLDSLYDFSITAGDTFVYECDSLDCSNEEITVIGPGNISLSSDSSRIVWATSESYLGENKIIISQGQQSQIISLYINSPPRIIAYPERQNILQIGETFSYSLGVEDKNQDSDIVYKLVQYPEGSIIEEDGTIHWKPSFYQKDWHDFRVLACDGFDSTAVEFAIFVNHPLTIVSELPQVIEPGQNLESKIHIQDNKGALLSIDGQKIRIDNRFNTGIMEFEPLNQNPRQYVERFKALGDSSGLVQQAYLYNNSIILVYNFYQSKPEHSTIIKKFFTSIQRAVPLYKIRKNYNYYDYALNQAPDNFQVTRQGVLKWQPQQYQKGWNKIAYLVTDDYFTDEQIDSIYVNGPPKFVKIPDTMIFSDSLWQYQVRVRDINPDQKLNYKLIKQPDNMEISPQGTINWRPKNIDYKIFSPGLIVDDGMASDTVFARIIVDQKPAIVSKPDRKARTDIEYNYKIDARDSPSDSLTYRAIKIPEHAQFDQQTGRLIWTPRSKQRGQHQIVLAVEDTHGATVSQNFYVEVDRSRKTRNRIIITSSLSAAAVLGLVYFLVF